MSSENVLATLNVGESAVVLRRAEVGDLPAIVGLLAADQLGAARDGIRDDADLGTCRRPFAAIDRDPAHVLVVAQAGDQVVATMQVSFLPAWPAGAPSEPRSKPSGCTRISAAAALAAP